MSLFNECRYDEHLPAEMCGYEELAHREFLAVEQGRACARCFARLRPHEGICPGCEGPSFAELDRMMDDLADERGACRGCGRLPGECCCEDLPF